MKKFLLTFLFASLNASAIEIDCKDPETSTSFKLEVDLFNTQPDGKRVEMLCQNELFYMELKAINSRISELNKLIRARDSDSDLQRLLALRESLISEESFTRRTLMLSLGGTTQLITPPTNYRNNSSF